MFSLNVPLIGFMSGGLMGCAVGAGRRGRLRGQRKEETTTGEIYQNPSAKNNTCSETGSRASGSGSTMFLCCPL